MNAECETRVWTSAFRAFYFCALFPFVARSRVIYARRLFDLFEPVREFNVNKIYNLCAHWMKPGVQASGCCVSDAQAAWHLFFSPQ